MDPESKMSVRETDARRVFDLLLPDDLRTLEWTWDKTRVRLQQPAATGSAILTELHRLVVLSYAHADGLLRGESVAALDAALAHPDAGKTPLSAYTLERLRNALDADNPELYRAGPAPAKPSGDSHEPLKPGDVVRLRSGGPAMTVETREATGAGSHAMRCVWFTDDEHAVVHTFPEACLQRH